MASPLNPIHDNKKLKLVGKQTVGPEASEHHPWDEHGHGGGGGGGGEHGEEAEGDGESIWLMSYADLMTLLFGFFVMISSMSKMDSDNFDKVRREATEFFGGEFKKTQRPLEEELKEEFRERGMTNKALFQEYEKGIAITFRGSLFFESGSAEVREEAQILLQNIIPTVKKQQRQFLIIVEGHTDDNPINNEKFPSNWELSGQRAAAVLRLFEANSFDRNQLRAIGFADTVPVLPNRDPNGTPIADNQSQNRRVVIKFVPINKE